MTAYDPDATTQGVQTVSTRWKKGTTSRQRRRARILERLEVERDEKIRASIEAQFAYLATGRRL